MLEGLPELQQLNMYGNKVAEIIIPDSPKLLSKLETLDLGYNDLVWLPDDLDQLKALRTLKVMNNFLAKIPMRICDMDLKTIDVSSNPVTEPPIETCERGICSMRRYWHCIRMEEQSKKKALAEVQKKVQRQTSKKSYGRFMNPLRPKSASIGTTSPSSQLRKTTSIGSTATEASTASVPSRVAVQPSLGTNMDQQQDSKPPALATIPKPQPPKYSVSAPQASPPLLNGVPPSTIDGVQRYDSKDSVGSSEAIDQMILLSDIPHDSVTVNDTLKVIFVGMAMVGKTSMIKRLIEGKDAVVPTRDERTVGVDIYDWEPKHDKRFEHIDSRIEFQDKELAEACGDVDVKFSVWDFAGQHVYHATLELFFSSRALYVLVWDMGATNPATLRQKVSGASGETGAFKLYDSSDEEGDETDDETDLAAEEEERRADRALEHDIDEKVQFWIDCIQSTAPGAAILPVASFNDFFAEASGGEAEAKRRCNVLKQRLLKHEARRVEGIRERLQEYYDQNRADDVAAVRLRKLLCSYTRPKLIFGDDDDSVVRVSGTQYTGFDRLTEKIIGIGTGKNKGEWRYPIFHGHVGARIPRMRLEVREAVRKMRGRFKVVEWGYFINVLRDRGLTSVEDISDALHFLTNTGELSYFGGVMTSGSQQPKNPLRKDSDAGHERTSNGGSSENDSFDDADVGDDDDDEEEEGTALSMDDTSITAPSTADGSMTTVEDFMSTGLSQFVFLNPRWLVAAVACILRHDLDREIKETRRVAASGGRKELSRTGSFYDAHLNCPVITADDACLLWQYKRITKKAAKLAQEYSNNMTVTPFEFLQLLLIRFGVFVPIDLSVEKALFGGKEYQQLVGDMHDGAPNHPEPTTPVEVQVDRAGNAQKARFFFLPSLLGPCEPSEAWTYKTTDAWKATLCHSILFPDGVPPGLMERLTASVLSSIYAASSSTTDTVLGENGNESATYEGRLSVKEILCWRTAFYVKIGTQIAQPDGTMSESVVEIFTHLAGRDSHLCVGSDHMGVGMRRLITSGRGQAGDGARKTWKGGYLLVCKCINRVMAEYEGLEFEKQGFCPDCLRMKNVSEASCWDMTTIRSAVLNQEEQLRCQHGHQVDTRLVAGPFGSLSKPKRKSVSAENAGVPVQSLLGAVVVVGLWDGRAKKIVRVGSGFIVDKKRGLIVTAAHTLMNIGRDNQHAFGANYYGLSRGKVVVGVLPQEPTDDGKEVAVFRYFAQIVSKDPSFDRGECHVDACVLRITTRMENDVGGGGEECGDQPEILLLNNQRMMRNQNLPTLKLQDKCELEEIVRIVGYNQSGEGLLGPGEHLNRYVDFAKGYICMKFHHDEDPATHRERFKPREEIVVNCMTIGGHSGGPCVNQQGEVIGILSRADPTEKQRCYLVPASELKLLVSRAKRHI